jgi:hypothetical protein
LRRHLIAKTCGNHRVMQVPRPLSLFATLMKSMMHKSAGGGKQSWA